MRQYNLRRCIRCSVCLVLAYCAYLLLDWILEYGLSRWTEANEQRRNVPDACFDWWTDEADEQQMFAPAPVHNQSVVRFVTNHPNVSFCSGIGNQMFRFASLYGIGKLLGRVPAFGRRTRCDKWMAFPGELAWIFPVVARHTTYISPRNDDTFFARKFAARDCCHFEDPRNLSSVQSKNLALGSVYLQSPRFFDDRRNEIRKLFRFSPALCAVTRNEGRRAFSLFGDDKDSHKLCVHTRRGDFPPLWRSTRGFTQRAVQFVLEALKTRGLEQDISVVLLGEDKHFLRTLELNKTLIHRMHIPAKRTRGEDFSFGVLFCDSLLLTAQASTFGWWMGYLMRGTPGGGIFFNANFTGMDRNRENFLPNWTPIVLDQRSGALIQLP